MRALENPDMLRPPITDAGTVPNLRFSFSDTHMTLNNGGWSRQLSTCELPVATTLAGVNMRLTPGGSVRITDSTNFLVSKEISVALVEVLPGAMRELHWHPNNDEFQYYLAGKGRMTASTFDVRAGDIEYIPFCYGHYIQNTGNETLWYLEVLKSPKYADISLTQWMALTPKQIVSSNLNVGPELMNSLRIDKWAIVQFPGYT